MSMPTTPTHPSRERRQAIAGFGAVQCGMRTLNVPAAWLED
jgi:hypothetical protein